VEDRARDNYQLRQDLATSNQRLSSRAIEANQWKLSCETLHKEKDLLEAAASGWEGWYNEAKATEDAAKKELRAAQQSAQELRAQLQTHEQNAADVNAEVASLCSQVTHLQQEDALLRAENTVLHCASYHKDIAIDDLHAQQWYDLAWSSHQTDAAIEHLQTQHACELAWASLQITALRANEATHNQTISGLRQDHLEAGQQRDEAQQKADSPSTQLREKEEQRGTALKEVDSLSAQLQKIRDLHARCAEENADMGVKYAQMVGEVQAQKKDLQSVRQELGQRQAELDMARGKNQKWESLWAHSQLAAEVISGKNSLFAVGLPSPVTSDEDLLRRGSQGSVNGGATPLSPLTSKIEARNPSSTPQKNGDPRRRTPSETASGASPPPPPPPVTRDPRLLKSPSHSRKRSHPCDATSPDQYQQPRIKFRLTQKSQEMKGN
jgi:chromosome segregation ATPase